ncbi:MAG: hypothetical protein U0R19_35395 [Bryobacteraceae bacterium]|nr:hypothetical protein [Acidobacteriota bacterium]
MFESLDDTMKHDDQQQVSPAERWTKYLVTAVITIAVVGGLIFSIRMFE